MRFICLELAACMKIYNVKLRQMEHQQHYKMVPRDPSASVPMVIYDARPNHALPAPKVVTDPTQLIDIFPTIMELAQARFRVHNSRTILSTHRETLTLLQVPPSAWPADLDGSSLVPMISVHDTPPGVRCTCPST